MNNSSHRSRSWLLATSAALLLAALPVQLSAQVYQTLTSDPHVSISLYSWASKPIVTASYRGVSTVIGDASISASPSWDRVSLSYYKRMENTFNNSISYHSLNLSADLATVGQVKGLDATGIPAFSGTIKSRISTPSQTGEWQETEFTAYAAFAELSHDGVRMIETDGEGGTYRLDLVASQKNNHSWAISSKESWITITGTSNGMGSKNGINISVTANPGEEMRWGILEVATTGNVSSAPVVRRGFIVRQAANVATLSLSQEAVEHMAEAVEGQAITVDANVDWTANSTKEWLTITGGESGSGSGTITYALTPNTSTVSRQASITVAGGGLQQTFTVNQAGSNSSGAGPWHSGATHLADGWRYFEWFKGFRSGPDNWIFHGRHGWMFVQADNTQGMFLWDVAMRRWLWTNENVYPWMYAYGSGEGWVFFFEGGSPGSRWFQRGDTGQVVSEQGLRADGANDSGANGDLVRVEGGTHAMSMGTQTVSTFYIGRHEVTWGEWKAVRQHAAARGYDIGSVGAGCADDHPVHSVNWYDVLKWCNLKSELEGLTPVYTVSGAVYKTGQPTHTSISQNLSADGYRLPLEAEWEFAARGGNQTNGYTYSGSNDLNAVGWYWENSSGAACNLSLGRGTWPVGQKAANELGLYDMSGNVWEWCWDQHGSIRRIRGGSWDYRASYCTVSSRIYLYPDNRFNSDGFRLARSSGN